VVAKFASRQSFIIDPQGRIAKHYEDVDPDTHTDEVLNDLQQFMATSAS
jgi:peroxiredoxin Q/BCP